MSSCKVLTASWGPPASTIRGTRRAGSPPAKPGARAGGPDNALDSAGAAHHPRRAVQPHTPTRTPTHMPPTTRGARHVRTGRVKAGRFGAIEHSAAAARARTSMSACDPRVDLLVAADRGGVPEPASAVDPPMWTHRPRRRACAASAAAAGPVLKAVLPPVNSASMCRRGASACSRPSWATSATGYPTARILGSIERRHASASRRPHPTTSGAVANAHRSGIDGGRRARRGTRRRGGTGRA